MMEDWNAGFVLIQYVKSKTANMKTQPKTSRQRWALQYLQADKERWFSPTEVGNAYGVQVLGTFAHSSTGSPILKELVALGLAERSTKGHYRFKK